jgi:hypothetical protein
VLAAHRDRVTWDAPIRSVADVGRLPFAPRMLNVKPNAPVLQDRLPQSPPAAPPVRVGFAMTTRSKART